MILQLLRLAQKLNDFYLMGLQKCTIYPFLIEGQQVGFIKLNVMKELLKYPKVFCISECEHTKKVFIKLNPELQDYVERTEQLNQILCEWRQKELFPTLKGWRDEYFEVKSEFKCMMKVERAATSLFGLRRYGVHINGYIKHPKRGLSIWLQRRSNTKETWPGEWDNLVGGGLAVGYSVQETAVKEAAEESSIPSAILKNLVSAGSVSMFFENELGLYPNTEYVFDLELPLDFEPYNSDGEVQAFELLSAKECIERICSAKFKITSSPVIIDFLIRRGFIAPDVSAHLFMQLIELLHVPLDSLYGHRKLLS